jgi:cytochrome c-type biogenesis protein CcmH
MKMKLSWAAALLICAAALCDGQPSRVKRLEEQLIAPCCWAESVAVHRSEVAAEMRAGIEKMVAEGRTDREILDFYKAQYGARVLMEPEGVTRIWVYTIPIVVAAAGVWLVIWIIRRMVRSAESAA